MKTGQQELYLDAVSLLKRLISTPSFSKDEGKTAEILEDFFRSNGVEPMRTGNNVWARNRYFKEGLPSLMLNSHHDTVKPNPGYTLNPFEPAITNGKLYGLGSNDAGGALVSLVAAFMHFYGKRDLPFNLLMVASAEEEISGTQGIELLMGMLPSVNCAIVGEPTSVDVAIAEKGLMVLDCVAAGKA
jgi:acetylornithine deacetylase